MYFKGEYWIIENIYLKIWYMSLMFVINIHNIWIFPLAKSPIGLILHTYIYIHIFITPKKKGFELWIHDMSNRWSPKHSTSDIATPIVAPTIANLNWGSWYASVRFWSKALSKGKPLKWRTYGYSNLGHKMAHFSAGSNLAIIFLLN